MKKITSIHNKTKELDETMMPFNKDNVLLMDNDIIKIFNLVHFTYKHNNINIFRNAFVHKSYCTMKNSDFENGNKNCPVDCLPLQEMSYERQEFLGDAILGAVIASYMYKRYPDQSEGFLSKMRTKIVNGKMLGFLAESIGFTKFAIISKQVEEANGRNNYKIMEDIFEAFIGALYQDSNHDFKIVETYIICVIETFIDMTSLIVKNTNYKDMLITHMQNRYQDIPRFFEINVTNKDNIKQFTYNVKDRDNNILGTGIGNSKRDAENACSLNALKYYGLNIEYD